MARDVSQYISIAEVSEFSCISVSTHVFFSGKETLAVHVLVVSAVLASQVIYQFFRAMTFWQWSLHSLAKRVVVDSGPFARLLC